MMLEKLLWCEECGVRHDSEDGVRLVLAEIGVDTVRDWLEDQGYCVLLEWPTDG